MTALRVCCRVLIFSNLILFQGAAAAQEYQWWNTLIGATQANQNMLGNGAGVRVGVLDGLANWTHSEFGGRIDRVWVFSGGSYSFLDNHGSHVSGIIGAGQNGFGMVGIAPQVSISNVAVFDDFGFVGSTRLALDRARQDGATIANMSYGPACSANPAVCGMFAFADDMNAITKANKLFISKAAGNDGLNLVPIPQKAKSAKNMILVGAVDSAKNIASFSNRAGEACASAQGNCKEKDKLKYRFLVAPGVNITSTAADGGYVTFSGTSMAAPMVAGAAALLQSRWTFLKKKPGTTADILLTTAEDLGAPGVDAVYGRGLLRIDRAMTSQGRPMVSVGATVNGASFAAERSHITLSPAFGSGTAISNALKGIVFFDKFGRDFPLKSSQLVSKAASSFSLLDQLRDGSGTFDRPLVTTSLTEGLSFTTAAPGAERADAFAEVLTSQVGYLATLQPAERQPWRLAGATGPWSFSFGQRTDAAQDIAVGAGGELFMLSGRQASQPLAFLGGEGFYGVSKYQWSDNWKLGIGFVETEPQPEFLGGWGFGRTYLAQAEFKPIQNVTLQATQSLLTESNMMLGSTSTGAVGFGTAAHSFGSGLAASVQLAPSLSARLHYTEAFTATAGDTTLFREVNGIRSRSYGGALVKHGILSDNDDLGFSINRPLRIYGGVAVIDTPVGRSTNGTVRYERHAVSLAPDGNQTDYELGYRVPVSPALSVGFNIYYQSQLNNDPHDFDTGVLSSLRLAF